MRKHFFIIFRPAFFLASPVSLLVILALALPDSHLLSESIMGGVAIYSCVCVAVPVFLLSFIRKHIWILFPVAAVVIFAIKIIGRRRLTRPAALLVSAALACVIISIISAAFFIGLKYYASAVILSFTAVVLFRGVILKKSAETQTPRVRLPAFLLSCLSAGEVVLLIFSLSRS